MTLPEFELWREYHRRHGFEVDRIVWAIALAGAAVSAAQGKRIKAGKLVPRFWKPEEVSKKELIAQLSALPGAKVHWVPKGETLDGGQ